MSHNSDHTKALFISMLRCLPANKMKDFVRIEGTLYDTEDPFRGEKFTVTFDDSTNVLRIHRSDPCVFTIDLGLALFAENGDIATPAMCSIPENPHRTSRQGGEMKTLHVLVDIWKASRSNVVAGIDLKYNMGDFLMRITPMMRETTRGFRLYAVFMPYRADITPPLLPSIENPLKVSFIKYLAEASDRLGAHVDVSGRLLMGLDPHQRLGTYVATFGCGILSFRRSDGCSVTVDMCGPCQSSVYGTSVRMYAEIKQPLEDESGYKYISIIKCFADLFSVDGKCASVCASDALVYLMGVRPVVPASVDEELCLDVNFKASPTPSCFLAPWCFDTDIFGMFDPSDDQHSDEYDGMILTTCSTPELDDGVHEAFCQYLDNNFGRLTVKVTGCLYAGHDPAADTAGYTAGYGTSILTIQRSDGCCIRVDVSNAQCRPLTYAARLNRHIMPPTDSMGAITCVAAVWMPPGGGFMMSVTAEWMLGWEHTDEQSAVRVEIEFM